MSRPPISGFFRKLFDAGSIARRDGKRLLTVRLVTSLERSLERAAAFLRAGGSGISACGIAPWVEGARRDGLLRDSPGENSPGSQTEAKQRLNDLERELSLRADLVREQWEIRGPGLLAAIARQPGVTAPAEPIQIQLVLPLLGGAAGLGEDGQAWLEALLHDISPQFPEVLRVGWLVALQLTHNPAEAVQLLLHAAEEVDWLTADAGTLNQLQAWLAWEDSANQLSSETRPGSQA